MAPEGPGSPIQEPRGRLRERKGLACNREREAQGNGGQQFSSSPARVQTRSLDLVVDIGHVRRALCHGRDNLTGLDVIRSDRLMTPLPFVRVVKRPPNQPQ